MSSLYQSFRQFLLSLPDVENSSFLLAVSGGSDSMVLLHCFRKFKDEVPGIRVGVFHLNHQTRPGENEKEWELVQTETEKAGFAFHGDVWVHKPEAGNFQEAARNARRSILNQIRNQVGYRFIATGHHRDDQTETRLYRLFSGSSPGNLDPLPPTDDFYIRPLIDCSRQEILDTVANEKLEYFNDPSNETGKYTRNRIRHELIPVLDEVFGLRWRESLNHLAAFSRQWIGVMESLSPEIRERVVDTVQGGFKIDIQEFTSYNEQLLVFIIRQEFMDRWHIPLGFSWLVQWIHTDNRMKPGLPGGVLWKAEGRWLVFWRAEAQVRKGTVIVENCAASNRLEGTDLVPVLDADTVRLPLTVTVRQSGDRFQPLGMKDPVLLSDFYINRKIPIYQRDSIPVIRDSQGTIIWVYGYAISETVKWTSQTNRWIRLRLENHSGG